MDTKTSQRAPKVGIYVPRGRREQLERERQEKEQHNQKEPSQNIVPKVKEVSVLLSNLKISTEAIQVVLKII